VIYKLIVAIAHAGKNIQMKFNEWNVFVFDLKSLKCDCYKVKYWKEYSNEI